VFLQNYRDLNPLELLATSIASDDDEFELAWEELIGG
jgi:hypothetical protein